MEQCGRGAGAPSGEISLRRVVGFLIVLAGLAWPALASAQGASQLIQQLGGQAIQVLQTTGGSLEQRERQFRAILSASFDMPGIARFVLGRHWQQANDEQRQDYVQLFTEYVLQTYSARLGGYSGETLAVTGERPAGQRDTVVTTRINRPSGAPVDASWRVRQGDDSRFRIIDVEVAGVSMTLTQRDEFSAVVQRYGIDGLNEVLRARTTKAPATAAR